MEKELVIECYDCGANLEYKRNEYFKSGEKVLISLGIKKCDCISDILDELYRKIEDLEAELDADLE